MTLVQTRSGAVRGFIAGDVETFKGIPYGGPTAGGGRFKPQSPPPAWPGVREALTLGPSAPAAFGTAADCMANPEILAMIEGAAEPAPASEDCLVLNVWTPSTRSGRRPVMVWCHGGGFFAGSGGGKWTDGAKLALHGDVVIVSFNHRLNILGFLYLGELGGEAYAESGNIGMLDIVAALRWVRNNIAAFGGDPENVTLFGQSGGGFKISMLMAMPAARGLFHKAIVQSGSALRATLPEIATRHALWTLDALGLDPSKVAALESVPLDRLIAAATAVLRRVSVPGENPFTPVLDGGTLPRHPFDPDAPPGANAISMLIGTAKDESRMLLAGDPGNFDLTPDRMRSLVTAFLDGNAETADGIIAVIEAERPGASSSDIFFALTTARMLTANAIAQAERQAARGTAFLYRFDWNIPILGGKLGAPHGVTTPFVFRTIDAARSMVGSGSEAHGLSEKISAAWLAFARTGDPNHAGLPPWPPYDATARATMILDNACRVVNDPDRALRLALSALAPMQI